MSQTIGHIDLHNIKPGDMLDLLDYVEWHMHHLLTTAEWKDVLVDYHEPFVERVWCEFKGMRVFLPWKGFRLRGICVGPGRTPSTPYTSTRWESQSLRLTCPWP